MIILLKSKGGQLRREMTDDSFTCFWCSESIKRGTDIRILTGCCRKTAELIAEAEKHKDDKILYSWLIYPEWMDN